MPNVAPAVYIQAASAIGTGLTAFKLRSIGLSDRYRTFFAYLIFRAAYVLFMLFLPVTSKAYFYAYLFAQPIDWFFYVAVVVELSKLVLERHKGLYTVGRWAMYLGVAVSVTLSAASLLVKIIPHEPQISTFAINLVMATERGLDFALAIYLILMLLFLNLYTVPLSRNIVWHAAIYTVFFVSGALGAILRTFFGMKFRTETDAASLAGSCACVLAWYFLLTPKGEEARVRQPWFKPEQEERILHQLDSLNATLLKVARK